MFVLIIVPLSFILRIVNASYKWRKKEYRLNDLLFINDLKLFSKSEEQVDLLGKTVHIFSTDIGMEFGMKKCGIEYVKE